MHHPIKSSVISLRTGIRWFSTNVWLLFWVTGRSLSQEEVCYIAINLQFIYYVSQTLLFFSAWSVQGWEMCSPLIILNAHLNLSLYFWPFLCCKISLTEVDDDCFFSARHRSRQFQRPSLVIGCFSVLHLGLVTVVTSAPGSPCPRCYGLAPSTPVAASLPRVPTGSVETLPGSMTGSDGLGPWRALDTGGYSWTARSGLVSTRILKDSPQLNFWP